MGGYLKEHKHCNVPQQYKSPDGYNLGLWVSNQRNRRSSLSIERLARLDAVSFDWDPSETLWKEGLQCLKSYKEREGHCGVPRGHMEDGFRLGRWVANKRANQRKLSVEHLNQLNELGFVWNVSRGRSRSSPRSP